MKSLNTVISLLFSLMLFVALSSCSKEEEASLDVTFSVTDISTCAATIVVEVDGLDSMDDAFMLVSLSSDSTMSHSEKQSTNIVENGRLSLHFVSLSPDQTYYYTARFIHLGINYDSGIQTFKTADLPSGMIDMGLSVRWSSCNLGATVPEECGKFYSWLVPRPEDDPLLSVKSFAQEETTILPPKEDPVQTELGSPYRMPTKAEWLEIMRGSNVTDAIYHSTPGVVFTSITTKNTIFIPSSYMDEKSRMHGTYWSSTYSSEKEKIGFRMEDLSVMYVYPIPYVGYTVRFGNDVIEIPCSEPGIIRPVSE